MVKFLQVLGAAALASAAAVELDPQALATKTKTTTEVVFSVSTKTKTVTDKVHSVVTETITNTRRVGSTTTTTVTASARTVTISAAPTTVTITAPASACFSNSTSSRSSTSSSSSSSSSINTSFTTTLTAIQATGTAGLNDYAKAIGKYLGTAVDIPGTGEAQDPIYMRVANNTHEFGSRTPANTMKWYATEPQRGVFDFSGGDYFVSLAHATGINHIRCHNLVWHSQLPSWLTNPATPWDNATLVSILKNHVTTLVSHFGDNCTHWDVVNEAFNDDATASYRTSLWYNTIGPEFIPIAFSTAQAVIKANNLKVKLYYNDYNNEGPNTAKTNQSIAVVKQLQARGIQIDGVGMQSHFIIGNTWGQGSLQQTMANYAALNVSVAVTELDVRASSLPVSADQQITQFQNYKGTVAACALTPACVGVTLWDFDDTYSWIPGTFRGQGWGCPWFLPTNGTALVKKIAYDGIVDGFTGGQGY